MKTKKTNFDFFVYKKKHHWFIFPSIVFYYNPSEYYNDGKYSPSYGLTLRWLIFMVGIQIQRIYET